MEKKKSEDPSKAKLNCVSFFPYKWSVYNVIICARNGAHDLCCNLNTVTVLRHVWSKKIKHLHRSKESFSMSSCLPIQAPGALLHQKITRRVRLRAARPPAGRVADICHTDVAVSHLFHYGMTIPWFNIQCDMPLPVC